MIFLELIEEFFEWREIRFSDIFEFKNPSAELIVFQKSIIYKSAREISFLRLTLHGMANYYGKYFIN